MLSGEEHGDLVALALVLAAASAKFGNLLVHLLQLLGLHLLLHVLTHNANTTCDNNPTETTRKEHWQERTQRRFR